MCDELGRARDDPGWAAVVRLQRHALERRVHLIKPDDPHDRGSAPAVQRLVFVADGEQRVLGGGEDLDEQLLGGLDVLVLVDEHA